MEITTNVAYTPCTNHFSVPNVCNQRIDTSSLSSCIKEARVVYMKSQTQAPIMATPHTPLLSSPPSTRTSSACKALLFTLSLATIISVASLLLTYHPSSDLCTGSPNPSSCNSIVSHALLLNSNHSTPALTAFHNILVKSITTLNSAIATANSINGVDPALADCIHLLDLSRDRLTTAAGANARTWLSAVLTNYVTCLDGLDRPAKSTMEPHLQTLISLASASLAVLNSVDSSSSSSSVFTPIVRQFPAWVSRADRKLLEARSATAIQANVVVAQDGSGNYKTVQQAADSAPDNGKTRYVIYVKKGVYNENVSIGKKKKNVMVVGDGMDATVITGSLNFVDGTTTFNSATLAAVGDGLILQDLKIENTAGAIKHQAVALRVGADQAVINRCKIEAYQDTLYTHSLRQFYRDSTISGTVDFIFGNAAVVFQNCNLVARLPMSNQENTITAQGRTDPNQNTGTSIQNCQVVPAPELVPVEATLPTYLGRPWQEYSRTVYMQSYIGSHINPKGWLEWDGSFALNTLFYGEYLNQGPGAGTAGRVNWGGFHVITDPKVAQLFTVAGLIQGGYWLEATGVAFTEGL